MSNTFDKNPGFIENQTIGNMKTRILSIIFLFYIVAFLDRTNIGFAALTMNSELDINSAQSGLLAGIFFWGLLLI
jgi:ACS family tartrate transporter-like MFS transporter